MNQFKVTVAHYGHPSLKGAWHYSILLYNQPDPTMATAFHVTRAEGTRVFELYPEDIVGPRRATSFQGELAVGWIPGNDGAVAHFRNATRLVNTRSDDQDWNCQSWAADVLAQLHSLGLHIKSFTKVELVAAMAGAK